MSTTGAVRLHDALGSAALSDDEEPTVGCATLLERHEHPATETTPTTPSAMSLIETMFA
jgi:hypothetical protein